MTNLKLYAEVIKLRDYLEDHQDQSGETIKKALYKLHEVWTILERRKGKR